MEEYQIEELENGLVLFTIKRGHKRNAINYEVMDGLQQAISKAKQEHIKGLVITGEGDQAFCSGGDLASFDELRTEDQAYGMLSKMGNILYELFMLPKVTVALMNGIAIGGGCELATACDFRVARAGIKAGFVQGNLCITTGWGGGSMLLERLALSNAMKMLLEAKRYRAEELYELEFVQHIYEEDPMLGLQSALGTIFLLEEGVLRSYKEMAIRKWEDSNLKEKIEKEIRQCAVLWASEAHHLQVEKFLNRSLKKSNN